MRGIILVAVEFAVALGGCGGRTPPAGQRDGGATTDAGRYDAGFHDGPIHGDAGAKCDDLANRYAALAESFDFCDVSSDCVAYGADCAIAGYAGLDPCWLYVGRSADTSRFAELSQEWQRSGCPLVLCELCASPPSLTCQGGRCVPGGSCDPATCVSGPDTCCGRDCDSGTFPTCNTICPPVPPPDPLCACPTAGACSQVQCDAAGGCPPGSRCVDGRCAVIPRCERPPAGCTPFFTHCSCSWSCVDGDAHVDDCPATCDGEQQLRLAPPVCDCGPGGCGMVLCDPATSDCGFGYLCREVPGSLSYSVCTECANCELSLPPG